MLADWHGEFMQQDVDADQDNEPAKNALSRTSGSQQQASSTVKPIPGAHVLFWGFAASLLASIGYFGATNKPWILVTAIGGCLGGMALARFDSIKRFKGPGVEFETHPLLVAARRATEEAVASAQQLRALGASLARVSLEVLGRASILGEFPWSAKIRLRDDLKDQLRALGVTATEITEADRIFRELIGYRLARDVVDASRRECRARRGDKADEVYMAFQTKTGEAFDFSSFARPDSASVRELVSEYSSDEVESALREYEHFERTGELRRPDLLDKTHQG